VSSRANTLAEVYSLAPAEVDRWPEPVKNVLHRNAVRRGWLMNDTDNRQESEMTDNTPTVVLQDEYLDAARELVAIAAEEKALAERKARAKQIIEKALAEGERGISPDGEPLVTVRTGSARFDPDAAARNLPTELLQSISVTVPDGKRAKAILSPALYDLCVTRNKPSVVAL
jgi:hypothetical protein